jgi:hypothetical protein
LAALFADNDAWCYTTQTRAIHPTAQEWPRQLQLAGD